MANAVGIDRWPFLTPLERLARFDVASKALWIGRREIKVDADVLREMFELARELQHEIRTNIDLTTLRDSLENWANMLAGLATSHRMSQRVVDDLLSLLSSADASSRDAVIAAVGRAASSPVRSALAECIRELKDETAVT